MGVFYKKHISTFSDEELIPLIIKKNDKAFEELYKRYSKKMYYFFLMRFNYNKEIADDLLQDLFLHLLNKINSFDINQKFSTWFYTIASNNCINEYKKPVNKIEKVTLEEEVNFLKVSSVHDTSSQEDFQDSFTFSLENELIKLKSTHRTAFVLKYKENLPIKAIATIMNCSEGTVKSRLHYTVKSLAQSLTKYNIKKK